MPKAEPVCVQCGVCLSACPVYAARPLESLSPRGRLRVALALGAGEINVPPENLSSCLLCGQCDRACPAGIKISEKIRLARSLQPLRPDLAFLIKRPKITRAAQPTLAFVRSFLADGPLWARKLACRLPALAARPFKGIPVKEREKGGERERVLFFAGCLNRALTPEIARATVKSLRFLGADAVSPPELVCCGRPYFMSGNESAARKLAERNLDVLAKIDFDSFVTACPSCERTIRDTWRAYKLSPKRRETAARIASCHADINVWLRARGAAAGERNEAYWHKPCLLNAEGEGAALYVTGLTPSAAKNICCGAPLFAEKKTGNWLARVTRDEIAATMSKSVVTACPACVLTLRETFAANGDAIAVTHSAQIYAARTKSGSEKSREKK